MASNDWVLLLGGLFLSVLSPSLCRGQEYQVDLRGENRVSFVSDAPLEDFRGITSRVDGFAFLPGEGVASEDPLEGSEFHFEVDLASLDTGLGLRNRHMRENYLETDRFPFATFSGRVTRLEAEGDGGFAVVAEGDFEVHGRTQRREISCLLTSEGTGTISPGETREVGPLAPYPELRVQCAFTVTLSDHGIPIPKLMFMKIDEVMEVEVDFQLLMVMGRAGSGAGGSP